MRKLERIIGLEVRGNTLSGKFDYDLFGLHFKITGFKNEFVPLNAAELRKLAEDIAYDLSAVADKLEQLNEELKDGEGAVHEKVAQ